MGSHTTWPTWQMSLLPSTAIGLLDFFFVSNVRNLVLSLRLICGQGFLSVVYTSVFFQCLTHGLDGQHQYVAIRRQDSPWKSQSE